MSNMSNLNDVPMLKADTQWFHVFKSMIESGELANISGSALKVYLVLKSHSNYNDGDSYPSVDTIAAKSGLSVSQVMRCTKELQELAYIAVTKKGRANHYVLREKITIHNEAGNSAAEVTWDYVPKAVTDAVEELKRYLKTGQVEKTQIIQIQNLQLNINTVVNGGVIINNQAFDLSQLGPELEPIMRSLLVKAGIKIPGSYTHSADDTCHG